MKKRKSMIALSIIEIILVAAPIVMLVLDMFVLTNAGFNFFTGLWQLLMQTFQATNIPLLFFPVIGVLGLTGLVFIIWLIVDIVRKRLTVILYVILLLLAAFMAALYYPYVYRLIFGEHRFDIYSIIILGLGVVGVLFGIILFIVDMATGKRIKTAAAPVIEKKAIAPVEEAPVEEAPVEEERTAPLRKPQENPVEEENVQLKQNDETVVVLQEDIDGLSMEEEPVQEEPAEEEKPAKKPAKKPAAKKGAKKDTGKKAKKEAEPKEEKEEPANGKAYHVSRRADLNKWQVKAAGGSKALKLFNTQKEAIEYANQLSQSTGGSVRVHSKAGKLRKSS